MTTRGEKMQCLWNEQCDVNRRREYSAVYDTDAGVLGVKLWQFRAKDAQLYGAYPTAFRVTVYDPANAEDGQSWRTVWMYDYMRDWPDDDARQRMVTSALELAASIIQAAA